MGHALIEAIAFFPVCFAFHPMQWTISIPPSDAFFITLPVYFGLNSRFKNADGYRTVIGENKQRSCGNFITIISKQMILLNFVLLLKNHRIRVQLRNHSISPNFFTINFHIHRTTNRTLLCERGQRWCVNQTNLPQPWIVFYLHERGENENTYDPSNRGEAFVKTYFLNA